MHTDEKVRREKRKEERKSSFEMSANDHFKAAPAHPSIHPTE
jgi:hypothetical protein